MMNKHFAFPIFFLAFVLVTVSSGCNLLPKIGKPGTTLPGGQGNVPQVAGYWHLAFLLGSQTYHSNILLRQEGNKFTGEGTDDNSNLEFVISDGVLDGSKVVFQKKYQNNPNSQPVQYTGTIDVTQAAPYMSGAYVTTINGKQTSGEWEAEMTGGNNASGAPATDGGEVQQDQVQQAEAKAPHLSGKWEMAYEYNFKTIKSTMYLEQDGGKVIGHGQDKNTKEKFLIERGWYHFPKLTIIRKYVKGKGAASNRTMTFKADVTVVNDADYQGPYLSGKTDGGGAWEAQQVK